jgi:hypothetical protein
MLKRIAWFYLTCGWIVLTAIAFPLGIVAARCHQPMLLVACVLLCLGGILTLKRGPP